MVIGQLRSHVTNRRRVSDNNKVSQLLIEGLIFCISATPPSGNLLPIIPCTHPYFTWLYFTPKKDYATEKSSYQFIREIRRCFVSFISRNQKKLCVLKMKLFILILSFGILKSSASTLTQRFHHTEIYVNSREYFTMTMFW